MHLSGLIAATFTPMRPDGSLNLAMAKPIVDHLIHSGVSGLYVCGSTGEGPLLTTDERKETAAAYVEAAAGRLPVVVQVGHSSVVEAANWRPTPSRSGPTPLPRSRLTISSRIRSTCSSIAWRKSPAAPRSCRSITTTFPSFPAYTRTWSNCSSTLRPGFRTSPASSSRPRSSTNFRRCRRERRAIRHSLRPRRDAAERTGGRSNGRGRQHLQLRRAVVSPRDGGLPTRRRRRSQALPRARPWRWSMSFFPIAAMPV